MDAQTKAVLVRARELVSRGWTRGRLARSAKNRPVKVESAKACKFCASGAILRAVWEEGGHNHDLAYRAVNALKASANARLIPLWNDEPGQAQANVVAAFDKALEG